MPVGFGDLRSLSSKLTRDRGSSRLARLIPSSELGFDSLCCGVALCCSVFYNCRLSLVDPNGKCEFFLWVSETNGDRPAPIAFLWVADGGGKPQTTLVHSQLEIGI